MHGPSVCAMALRVDDAARALDRADALLCPGMARTVGGGERRIPAVRAPDGTLIYLSRAGGRSFWEDDFDCSRDVAIRAALDRHRPIVLAVPPGGWRLCAVLARRCSAWSLSRNWIRRILMGWCRAARWSARTDKVRLVLNASESRATSTGRFVSAYAGRRGASCCIFDLRLACASAAVRARRACLLPMPINYYDDLSARWGLDDAALRALQRTGCCTTGTGTGNSGTCTPALSRPFLLRGRAAGRGLYRFRCRQCRGAGCRQARQYSVATNLL